MLCQAVVGRALDFDVYGVAGIVGRERGSSVKVRDLGRLRMVKKIKQNNKNVSAAKKRENILCKFVFICMCVCVYSPIVSQ